MRDDIIEKLRKHLSQPIDTEPAVVYLMCQIRKLLEQTKPSPKPLALWMHCHWALHVKLTKSETTLHLLERIDEMVVKTVSGFPEAGTYNYITEHQLFRELLFLDSWVFRRRRTLIPIEAEHYSGESEQCCRSEATLAL